MHFKNTALSLGSFLFLFLSFVISISPASATVIYVAKDATGAGDGTRWEDAFTTITAGLTTSASGDEIWVASGVYDETIALVSGVSIYGRFLGFEANREERNRAASPTVINGNGGEISIISAYSIKSATLDRLTIRGGNAAEGGGVYCNSSSLTLVNCTITGNMAGFGGALYSHLSSSTLTNCIIANNSADNGGCINLSSSFLILTNCTIAGNPASPLDNAGGLSSWNSSATAMNCILFNGGDELIGDDTFTVTYCCIEDGWEGEGNIEDDPLFVDAENGDYHLHSNSPCVDAGNPAVEYNDACLPPGLGTERNDMGAYGGPGNCAWPIPPTLTPTPAPTPTPGYHGWIIYGDEKRK